MSRRLRVSHVLVQPVLVWDDGEHLAPGPSLQPQQVAVPDLAHVADELPAQLAAMQAQIEASAEPALADD